MRFIDILELFDDHFVVTEGHAVALEELLDISNRLRPYTADAMKIEVAPWIRDYVVDMEDLYTELTLEEIKQQPIGI